MNDRRGHRKLRLTSRKHFKSKPKRTRDALQMPLEDMRVSLPISSCIDVPLDMLDQLLARLKRHGAIPPGLDCLCVQL